MILSVSDKIYKEREVAKANGIPVIRDVSFDLLLTTVATKGAERILEIGTAWGYSGIAMLQVLPKAHLTGIELDDLAIAKSKENYKRFGVEDRTTLFCGDAGEIIPVLTGKYDFIFLDGPKGHYYEYLPYLTEVLEVGGVIFADNIDFQGYVLGKRKPTSSKHNTIINSMKNYLSAVTTNENYVTTVLDVEDGVAITVKVK